MLGEFVNSIYRKVGDKVAVIDILEMATGSRKTCKNFLVTRVNVPKEFRRKGIGTEMLNELISDAEKEGVTLYIEPNPYPDVSMTKVELVKFYKKFGFKFISYNEYMKREPSENSWRKKNN